MKQLTTNLSRRNLLFTSGAMAAGMSMFADVSASAQNPATQVEDRTTNCKLTALRAQRVGTKVYLKLETNHGVVGWGEVTGLEPATTCKLAESLFELLDGENPTRIEHLWQKIYRSHRDMRGGSFMVHTLSAIDMALWDITGKLWGVPVYRLLGGPTRDKLRVYPSAKAHKPGTGGPHSFSGTPAEVERLVKMVKDTRERLGPEGAIIFDAHSSMPPPLLIQFANAIGPYDVMFIEEPAVPGTVEVFMRIKEAVRVPLGAGERDRTIWGFLPYLMNRCLDVLQPDCGHTGGITQMKKIATLGEAFMTPLAPHCTMSELGLSASLHASAAIPFFLIHEAYLDGHIMPRGVATKSFEVDANGYASLPQGPGLGVEVDESKFAEVNADPKRQFKWPTPKSPDSSVIDY